MFGIGGFVLKDFVFVSMISTLSFKDALSEEKLLIWLDSSLTFLLSDQNFSDNELTDETSLDCVVFISLTDLISMSIFPSIFLDTKTAKN